MGLTGLLTLNGIPTVYVRDDSQVLEPAEVARVHCQFWNQCVATVLLLRDSETIRVFSSMTPPMNPSLADENSVTDRLVETINVASQTLWAERFYLQLGTGQYYSAGERVTKFDPRHSLDAYLLDNLGALRDELTDDSSGHIPLQAPVVHAFLGRLLFVCYLSDRGIIKFSDYFPGLEWRSLQEVFAGAPEPGEALYCTLFPKLKEQFNSSMFDEDLTVERTLIQPSHLAAVRQFLDGAELRTGQRSLGFWAYDFRLVPVETVSAIYENFLEKEKDKSEKRKAGEYYTPRFLAELTIDLAVEGKSGLHGSRCLDPACGSGIFLVLIFGRLAAEWRFAQRRPPSTKAIAVAMRNILGTLRGVDSNLTACRIACFSLYIAYLDQFEPPGLREYMKATRERLPRLLRFRDQSRIAPDIGVVFEGDVFDVAKSWAGKFDVVIGNPPWSGRGTKQVAHEFMNLSAVLLSPAGRSCLLLPSKVFFNQTDLFQSEWLRRVTLEKVVQLADYRFILFKNALCPCAIVRFTNRAPELESHEVEYITPKVSRIDLRDGVIAVSPGDRKRIPLRQLLNAAGEQEIGVVWKSHFWGTRRDLKLLDFLLTFPALGDYVDELSKTRGKREKRWAVGVGCKGRRINASSRLDRELKPFGDDWSPNDPLVTTEIMGSLPIVPKSLCTTLGEHFAARKYLPGVLYSKPDNALFTHPLVLWNRGFTVAAFFDYDVRFLHALHVVSGPAEDSDYLLFLTAFLGSKLARYFVFHTGASIGIERDQVHLEEALRLPFYLPDSDVAHSESGRIITDAATKLRQLQKEIEADRKAFDDRSAIQRLGPLFDDDYVTEDKWLDQQREKAQRIREELNDLVFEYFALNDHERALVSDTCDIFDRSATPGTLRSDIPTLRPIEALGLEPYSRTITEILNGWASGSVHISASGGVDQEVGLALVQLNQTAASNTFEVRSIATELGSALERLQCASPENVGALAYLRGMWIFDGPVIYLVKPALAGQWTRTAAINDAADIYASIVAAGKYPE